MSRSAALPADARPEDAEDSERSARPGRLRCVMWVAVAGWMGILLASLALIAPGALGVATVRLGNGATIDWFPVDTLGGFCANVAVLATILWGCTWAVRGVFRVGGGPVPASSWTALTLAPAIALALTPLATTVAAGIGAAIALNYTAFAADGTARPEPLDRLSTRARHALRVGIPVLTIGIATAYAVYHPLTIWSGGGELPAKPGRTTATLSLATIQNDGGRPVRILAVEPGVERGYALHLTGVAFERTDTILPGESDTRPFHPFTLRAHHEAPRLSLSISRAGCRPGRSGRIESVRVRYLLGGERTMLLKLDPALALSC
jgi:hypothetical protein